MEAEPDGDDAAVEAEPDDGSDHAKGTEDGKPLHRVEASGHVQVWRQVEPDHGLASRHLDPGLYLVWKLPEKDHDQA